MNIKTQKQVAAVTGGGSGQSICLMLANHGYFVIALDINLEAARHTQVLIEEKGAEAASFQLDVSDHTQVQSLFNDILKDTSVDVLVNSAGIGFIGTLEQTQPEDLDRVYQVNVKGTYNCMHAVITKMKQQQSGVIINMASIASSVGIADRFAYSMSKGAVLTMTYSVARDYVNTGIRCNCISPGRVHTPFVDTYLEKNYPDNKDEMFEKLSKSQPMGRMGKPDEIAALVQYLCSDAAAFITGSNFPIDGGFVTINN